MNFSLELMPTNFKRAYAALLSALTLVACGDVMPTGGGLMAQNCKPLFSGSGLSVYVTHVSDDTYRFTLCENARPSQTVFTVYGADNELMISSLDPATKNRSSHITDVQRAGDWFEVSFGSGDLWFVVYQDSNSGGQYNYATTTEMVRGNLEQVPLNQVTTVADKF